MNIVKKALKTISIATIATAMTITTVPTMTTSATTVTFLQGDVDGDGLTEMSDLISINMYLLGQSSYNNQYITRMDTNDDKIIDKQDYNRVLDYNLRSATPQTVERTYFENAINDETRTYWKHNYSSSDLSSYTEYTLSNTITPVLSTCDTPLEARDYENINTVKLNINDTAVGSGFIVDNHIVATAAHCVVNKDNSSSTGVKFIPNIKVEVYDSSSINLTASYTAKEVHIPVEYKEHLVNNNYLCDNYDYALIYVEEDLSQHGIWNLGYMTTEFMSTGTHLVTSGFTKYPNDNVYERYYDSDPVAQLNTLPDSHNDREIRFHTLAQSQGGKSGGPVYYESVNGNNTIKSVVGICTGGGENIYTWGTRITPTIIRFLLNNTNINNN